MLDPFMMTLGCVLRANPLLKGFLGAPVGDMTRPLRGVAVRIVDGRLDLQAFLLAGNERRVSCLASEASCGLFVAFLGSPRLFIIDQTVALDDMHGSALRRTEAIDHGVRPDFDADSVNDERVPLIMSNGMAHR